MHFITESKKWVNIMKNSIYHQKYYRNIMKKHSIHNNNKKLVIFGYDYKKWMWTSWKTLYNFMLRPKDLSNRDSYQACDG